MTSNRGPNPESLITSQIRNTLNLLRIPHYKTWSGIMGEKGISDIVGVIPGGRALFIEIKTENGKTSPYQDAFLSKYGDAGALAFVARSPQDVIKQLSEAGFEPAKRISAQFGTEPKR